MTTFTEQAQQKQIDRLKARVCCVQKEVDTLSAGGSGGNNASTLQGNNGAYYLSRINHTDTQSASTISDFTSASQAVGDTRYLPLTAGVGKPLTGTLYGTNFNFTGGNQVLNWTGDYRLQFAQTANNSNGLQWLYNGTSQMQLYMNGSGGNLAVYSDASGIGNTVVFNRATGGTTFNYGVVAPSYYIGVTPVIQQSGGNLYYTAPSNSFIWNNAAGSVQNMVLSNAGGLSVAGSVTGSSFIKPGGTSSQFLKADGSLDSNTYITALADLTPTDSTLSFSGTYNGSTARNIGLNLANANTWTGIHTFNAQINSQNVIPSATTTYNIGSSSAVYSSVYTNAIRASGTGAGLLFNKNATQIAQFSPNNNNFLIGTTTDIAANFKLQVSGDGYFTGLITSSSSATIPQVLSQTTAINAKTTGSTTLYTVPTGKTLVVIGCVVKVTAASAITTGLSASVSASTSGTVLASNSMSGLTVTPQIFQYPVSGISVRVGAGEVVSFVIGTAATGTSQTVGVDLIGYLY